MRKRLAAVFAVCLVWLVTSAALAVAADDDEMIWLLDQFNTQSYAGSDGPDYWETRWTEYGESDGPGSGNVGVWPDFPCWNHKCMKIGGDGVALKQLGVFRVANLEGTSAGKLCFDFKRHLIDGGGGRIVLKISGDGGQTWNDLAVYSLSRDDETPVHQQFDIDQWLGPNTVIGFFGKGNNSSAYFAIDNVEIQAEYNVLPPPSTTLTTTTTTQPPTPTTTTTTTQPPTTTTTTQPPTTTTTQPPTTTTTTQPPTTTTTTTPPPTPPPGTPQFPEGDGPVAPEPFIDSVPLALSTPLADANELAHPGPVTQVLATVTTSAATLGTHILPAAVLGVVIAFTALAGLGRRSRDEYLEG